MIGEGLGLHRESRKYSFLRSRGVGDAEKAKAHRAEIVVFMRSGGVGDA